MISTAHLIGSLLAADNSGGSALSLLFLPLMLVGAYFLLIRPQRRRQKETTVLQGALAEGDEVITTSGMYGFITGFDGDIIWLEVDDNIQIRVARAAVQRKVDTSGLGASSKGSTTIDDIVEDESNDK
jgi:preprotein translocase subunit YajC